MSSCSWGYWKLTKVVIDLKGQCHEIFDFCFFSWISFPQAPEYTNRAVSNFNENSRRYSQLKVHHRCRWHRWQMAKIFKLKNFNFFVWTPLGSRVNIYINFCFQVQFKMTAAWYCTHYLPPVSLLPVANLPPASLIPVAICHRRRWHRTGGKFAVGIVDTGGKFATGVNNTSKIGGQICRRCRWYRQQFCRRRRWHRWQICHRCRWYRWCTLTYDYLREFWKKIETVVMQYSGAGGKLIHQKNQKQKISWHCPFNEVPWVHSLQWFLKVDIGSERDYCRCLTYLQRSFEVLMKKTI